MLNIIPYPSRTVQINGGVCVLSEMLHVEENEFSDWCAAAFVERTHIRRGESKLSLRLQRDASMEDEAYKLEIRPASLYVTASSEQGVIWALTTAANLLDGNTIPCCVIEDAPRYPHRGIHLDCARHFFPIETVKRVVEGMSLAKLNVLHWHLSDDQGWRIESKQYPMLHQVSGDYYTQDEIRALVEFARIRGVEVIPEIDMPGHTAGILAAYPELSCSGKTVSLAASGGIYPIILCPGKEETLLFIEKLLREIIPLFAGPRFHIGGDEAPKTEWAKCPHCQRRMQAEDISNLQQLQGWFTARVKQILERHGKQAVCWNETLLAANAPQNIQIQYWTLQHRAAMEPFIQKGGQWIYSDMFELYFDYPYSMTPLKKVYSIAPHFGKSDCSKGNGLLGMECCLWTEHVAESSILEQLLFPRSWAVAELCWCGKRDYAEFVKRLRAALAGAAGNAVRFAPDEKWDPRGKARRQDALAYFTKMNSAMSSEVRAQTVENTAPNKEFAQSFMTKFFRVSDLPFLLVTMMKGGK